MPTPHVEADAAKGKGSSATEKAIVGRTPALVLAAAPLIGLPTHHGAPIATRPPDPPPAVRTTIGRGAYATGNPVTLDHHTLPPGGHYYGRTLAHR